jgi:hypothetical protein
MACAEASLTAKTAVAAVATCIMNTRRVEVKAEKWDMNASCRGDQKILVFALCAKSDALPWEIP